MIAKGKKGRGFRGVLDYNLQEGKGYVLHSNMAGDTPRALAREFGAVRALRPTLGRAVQHTSISAAPGEHLTDDQWREIGRRYLQAMGFADSQALIIRHTDRDHEHIHIIANRVTNSGGVVSDSRDYARQDALMRQLEQDYGLQRVKPAKESPKRAPTQGEIAAYERTGQPSVKTRLQALLDAAIEDCRDFTAFAERLEAEGVQIVPTVQQGGARLSGLLFMLDGVKMKGSDLGKSYTAKGIQTRGIAYEQSRDYAAISRCRQRAELDGARTPEPAGRGEPAGAGEEARRAVDRRGLGEPHRADAGRAGGLGADGLAAVGAGDRARGQGGAGSRQLAAQPTERHREGGGSVRDLPAEPMASNRLADGVGGAGGAVGGGAAGRIAQLRRWAEAARLASGLPQGAGRDTAPASPKPAPTMKKKDVRAFLDDFWSTERQAERAAQEKAARDLVERERWRRVQEEQAREARRQQPPAQHLPPEPPPVPELRPRPTRRRGRSGPGFRF